jgi:hypothetical protein
MTNKGKVVFGKRKTANANPWSDLEKAPGVTTIETASR